MHHPQSLRSARLIHRLGPRAGELAQDPTAIQQVVNAPFNDVALTAVQVGVVGGELTGFGQRMEGDLFSASIVNAQDRASCRTQT